VRVRVINAPEVDPDSDVVKVVRKGFKAATGSTAEKRGTLLVEMRTAEAKASVMKTKKMLADLPDEGSTVGLKFVKIKNMRTQSDMNQEWTNRQLLRMIPGGDRYYIAGNGSLRQAQERPSAAGLPGPRPPFLQPNFQPPSSALPAQQQQFQSRGSIGLQQQPFNQFQQSTLPQQPQYQQPPHQFQQSAPLQQPQYQQPPHQFQHQALPSQQLRPQFQQPSPPPPRPMQPALRPIHTLSPSSLHRQPAPGTPGLNMQQGQHTQSPTAGQRQPGL
jgi:hypothetical protein